MASTISTLPPYGQSESLLGHVLSDTSCHFHLATKVRLEPEDFDYSADSVLWSLERSLKRLKISKLAVAQIHEVNIPGWQQIMRPNGALAGQPGILTSWICATERVIPVATKQQMGIEQHRWIIYGAASASYSKNRRSKRTSASS